MTRLFLTISALVLTCSAFAAPSATNVAPNTEDSPVSVSQPAASATPSAQPSEATNSSTVQIETPKRVLKIGLSERPPYSMKNDLGEWQGVAVSLWEEIAKNLGLQFQYVECIQEHLHDQLKNGEIDIIPVTGESSRFLDTEEFTQPYLFSKSGAVVAHLSVASSIENIMKHLIDSGMFTIVMSMFLTMFVMSVFLVHFEGRRENGHFEGSRVQRFANALWYTAVTMTSVGYGDTARLSPIGRMITFAWMLMGILFVSLFTGSVVSAITTTDITSSIVRVEDLVHYRCGCLVGTKLERYLLARGIPTKKFPNYEEGFAALARSQITAFAGDAISANYVMNNDYPGQFKFCMIPAVPLVYAMSFRKDDPDYEAVNGALLKIVLADDWRSKIERWSGPMPF